MPLLDKLTLKNPILLWLQKRGMAELINPLRPIVQRHFMERKVVWENNRAQESERETLVDRFLAVEAENPGTSSLKPEGHAMTMVLAGSETT